jgi:acyl dehydratase
VTILSDKHQNPPLYLDDLAVGERFTSATHRLDQDQIQGFAEQFDPQPFHLDDAAAQDTLFGGLAASGWHTAAITMRLLVRGGLPLVGGIIGVSAEITWPRPTRPNDVLRVESEVIDIVPSKTRPDRGMVTVRAETRTAGGDTVPVLNVKVVVSRRAVR